jgi:hypothetical protein
MALDILLATNGCTCALICTTLYAYILDNEANVADALNQLKGNTHDRSHLDTYEALFFCTLAGLSTWKMVSCALNWCLCHFKSNI